MKNFWITLGLTTGLLAGECGAQIIQNTPPVISDFDTIYGVEPNQPFSFDFGKLSGAVTAYDIDGDSITFQLTRAIKGQLLVNGIPAVAGVTHITPTDSLIWIPPVNVSFVTIPAFEMRAYDGSSYSLSSATVYMTIGRANTPPELYDIASFGTAVMNESLNFTFSQIKPLITARDVDGDPLSYRVFSVGAGTLTIDGAPAAVGDMLFETNSLKWLPPTGFVGNAEPFRIVAFDGKAASLNSCPVKVSVIDPTPQFWPGRAQVVLRDSGEHVVSDWAQNIQPALSISHFEVSTDNTGLFLFAPVILNDGTLHYTVQDEAYGVATVTATLVDQAGRRSAAKQFTITVLHVNYPPTAEIPGTVEVHEDCGPQAIPGGLRNVTAGAGEAQQVVSWTVTTSHPGLYKTRPSIDAAGVLRFEPASNAFGEDTLTITLRDNGGTLNGGMNSTLLTCNISVLPQYDSPIVKAPALTLVEDTAFVANVTTTDVDTPMAEVELRVNSFDTVYISAATISQSGTNFTLSITPAADAFGNTEVELSATDGHSTVTTVVAVKILEVNDAPTFSLSEHQIEATYLVGPNIVSNFASFGPGAFNETNKVSFDVIPTDLSFFKGRPRIMPNGDLLFEVSGNTVATSCSVAVTAKDNGGKLRGGQDRSVAQVFTVSRDPSVLLASAGSYNGLFYATNDFRRENSGAFTMLVTRNGACSGKLTRADGVKRFAGRVDYQGNVQLAGGALISAPEFKIKGRLQNNQVKGFVTASNWQADLLADKAIYDGLASVAPDAGHYTLSLHSDSAGTPSKIIGYTTIDAKGVLKFFGELPGGKTLMHSAVISQGGHWPMFVPAGENRSAIGWLQFSESVNSDIDGGVVGFGGGGAAENLNVVGSVYRLPVTTNVFGSSVATATIRGQDGVSASRAVVSAGKVYWNAGKMSASLQLQPTTGRFSGSLFNSTKGTSSKAPGVFLQKQKRMVGYVAAEPGAEVAVNFQ